MLQPRARQSLAERKAKGVIVAKGWPEKLFAVGRKTNRAVDAAMHREGMAPVLRQILAVHDDLAKARVRGDEVVDVLRDIGLVVHQEAPPAEADVLDQNGVHRAGAPMVFELDAPDPGGAIRVEEKRDAMADAERLARPDEAIGTGAELNVCARSDDLERRLAFNAQIDALDGAADRRTKQLIDENRAAFVAMLD